MSACPHCGSPIVEVTDAQTGEKRKPRNCLNCGQALFESSASTYEDSLKREESNVHLNPIHDFFSTLWEIFSQPSLFFSRLRLEGGGARPLVFALVAHWIGSLFAFFWQSLTGSMVSVQLHQILEKLRGQVEGIESAGRSGLFDQSKLILQQWIMGAGSVILDPFRTMLGLLFSSALVYVGLYFFVRPELETTGRLKLLHFQGVLRWVAFASVPSIFVAIPWVGGMTSWIFTLVLTVIAVRECYGVDTGRAALVAFFPMILGVILTVGVLALIFIFVLSFLAVA